MALTNRQIISALLSLLLVISGPVMAMSEVAGGDMDCGTMVMDQADDVSALPGAESYCITAPGMSCSSTGGLSKCGTSFALLPGELAEFIDSGLQPLINACATSYQNPFLASITPPPLPRS